MLQLPDGSRLWRQDDGKHEHIFTHSIPFNGDLLDVGEIDLSSFQVGKLRSGLNGQPVPLPDGNMLLEYHDITHHRPFPDELLEYRQEKLIYNPETYQVLATTEGWINRRDVDNVSPPWLEAWPNRIVLYKVDNPTFVDINGETLIESVYSPGDMSSIIVVEDPRVLRHRLIPVVEGYMVPEIRPQEATDSGNVVFQESGAIFPEAQ